MKSTLVLAGVRLGLTTFSESATCAGAEMLGDPAFDAIDNFVETGTRAVRCFLPLYRVRRPAAGSRPSLRCIAGAPPRRMPCWATCQPSVATCLVS